MDGDKMLNFIKRILKNNKEDEKNIELIRNSKYFDEKYYQLENPSVKGDLCKHYYYYGWKEGKSPSYLFSNDYYLKNNKDVKTAGINPLLHYITYGKKENRPIEKDNGLSLRKIYEKIYHAPYNYKLYMCDTKIKRINILFDTIDDSISRMASLFQSITTYCQNNDYQLRIVYSLEADFEYLKQFLLENKIVLPSQTIFLNLKSSNYLEVSPNEKYICTSWKNTKALINTNIIDSNIYYYLEDYQGLPASEYYQVSNLVYNSQITCLVPDQDYLNNLKKCTLKFQNNNLKFTENNTNQLYCDFKDMFLVGVELLNKIFLNKVLDSDKWMINILDNTNNYKFHFDTDVKIRNVKEIEPDTATLIFNISDNSSSPTATCKDIPCINAYIETEDASKKEIVLIADFKMNSNTLNSKVSETAHFRNLKNNLETLKENNYV